MRFSKLCAKYDSVHFHLIAKKLAEATKKKALEPNNDSVFHNSAYPILQHIRIYSCRRNMILPCRNTIQGYTGKCRGQVVLSLAIQRIVMQVKEMEQFETRINYC